MYEIKPGMIHGSTYYVSVARPGMAGGAITSVDFVWLRNIAGAFPTNEFVVELEIPGYGGTVWARGLKSKVFPGLAL